jgi:hypothetical protein
MLATLMDMSNNTYILAKNLPIDFELNERIFGYCSSSSPLEVIVVSSTNSWVGVII